MNVRERLSPLLSLALVLLAACSPAAAPAAAPAAPASAPAVPAGSQGPWDTVLAAARQEGTVAVAGGPGADYREAIMEFRTRYPDIQVEYQGLNARDMQARFYQEREAGQYLWDVLINGPTTFDITAKKQGDLVPLRPALMLPEVLDESAWFGGFQQAFLDSEKQYVFAFQAEVSAQVYVNRDIVPESELSTIQGLLDPRWKGKIAIDDPRFDGAGSGRIAAWSGLLGDDFVRGFLRQDLVLTRDQRQLAEWVVRGRYPIGVGIGAGDLTRFQQEGVGVNVKPLGGKTPEAWRLSSGFGVVRLADKAPHPNAAKVLVNWLLSKDGQTAWVTKAARASRRLDVPQLPGISPDTAIDYYDIDREENLPLRDRAKELATEALG